MIAYLFLLLGLFLISTEFFLPGGVMATVGVLVVFFSFIIAIAKSGDLIDILIFFAVMVLGLVITIRGSLWWVRRTKKDNSIFLGSDQEGFRASIYPVEALGKTVKTHTDLRPGGYVLWNGSKIQALSLSGYIPKGDDVIVVSGEGETLFVKKDLNKESL